MKVRNCLSLAEGTIVSGEELYRFFYTEEGQITFHSQNKKLFLFYIKGKNWINRNATYIVTHIKNSKWNNKERVWFKRIRG